VAVVTDLTVTGKVAQFGRGVLADVSAKLLDQFVDCLEANVLSAGALSGGGSAKAESAGGGSATTVASAAADTTTEPSVEGNGSSSSSSVRQIDAPEAAPVDLLDAAGAPVAKRALPAVISGLLVFLFLVFRRRRRRSRRGR
jgi:hypothetical protein